MSKHHTLPAQRTDLDHMIRLMRNYAAANPVRVLREHTNEPHVRQLFTGVLAGGGAAWIAWADGQAVGQLIALRVHSIWNPDIWTLQELCWWVEPEYRNTSLGMRLVREYQTHAQALLASGSIDFWSLSTMRDSAVRDLDGRWGLEYLEGTYICQEL